MMGTVTHPPLAHWFHVYAAGAWEQAVTEHCHALTRTGLYDELDGRWFVGFVGSADQIAAARCTLDVLAPGYTIVAETPSGWEQETLTPMWEWCQRNDGLVSYGHTKGASRSDPIDEPWRREMTWHNIVEWRRPVEALQNGANIAGCHWIKGGPSSVEGFGTGGMFGGNFWWTRADLLRQNPPPSRDSRYHAEHWLGQLSEVVPLTGETVCDLNPSSIGRGAPDWV